ncbi:hypothetical protein [Pelomicrobium sp. G1]|uniref:hypothetical protein n=1 Tax=unclassified Pelomicrobium TaxID=2815318 RepID=UPI003F76EC05
MTRAIRICLLGIALSLLAVGCRDIGAGERDYTVINTGIQGSGCWYDNERFVVLQGRQAPGTPRFEAQGIFYFDATKPNSLTRIDLSPLPSELQSTIVRIDCGEKTILFNVSGSIPSDPSVTRLYALRLGEAPELIAEMRGLYPPSKAVSLRGRYVVGNSRKMSRGIFEGHDDCSPFYLKQDFRALCWNTYGRNLWPLSKFVLAEYRWEETIQVKGEDDQPKTIKNPEAPLLGRDGKPLRYALVLYDLEHQVLTNLTDDPGYAGFGAGVGALAITPDESYAYGVCVKKPIAHGRGWDSVCRYRLDGKRNQVEEVFTIDPDKKFKVVVIHRVAVDSRGNVYVAVTGAKPIDGVLRFHSETQKIERLTVLPRSGESRLGVSPDGRWLAFTALDQGASKLFLMRIEQGGEQ